MDLALCSFPPFKSLFSHRLDQALIDLSVNLNPFRDGMALDYCRFFFFSWSHWELHGTDEAHQCTAEPGHAKAWENNAEKKGDFSLWILV